MKASNKSGPPDWEVYIIRAASGMLYTGITTDIVRRLQEHADGRGAKSLRGKGPLALVFREPVRDRSEASIVEARIKRLEKGEKEALIKGDSVLLERIKEKDSRIKG